MIAPIDFDKPKPRPRPIRYLLFRTPDGTPLVHVVDLIPMQPGEFDKVKFGGRNLEAGPSLEVVNHSPNGFEWGYQGSGPSQLALAILLDLLENAEIAEKHHIAFRGHWIENVPREGGTFHSHDILDWVQMMQEDDEKK